MASECGPVCSVGCGMNQGPRSKFELRRQFLPHFQLQRHFDTRLILFSSFQWSSFMFETFVFSYSAKYCRRTKLSKCAVSLNYFITLLISYLAFSCTTCSFFVTLVFVTFHRYFFVANIVLWYEDFHNIFRRLGLNFAIWECPIVSAQQAHCSM